MKVYFMHVMFGCFPIPRGVLFLSYSQLKQAIFDRAHVGASEFQRGFVSGCMRAHRMSMGLMYNVVRERKRERAYA